MNKKKILLIIFVILLFFCCISYFVIRNNFKQKEPPWYVLTSPLEKEVIEDLCQKLELTEPEREKLCEGESVYADEFLIAIRRTFKSGGNFEFVEGKLSGYLSRLVESDDGTYLYTYYDFKGDGVIEIAIYYKNKKLISVGSTQNYDDWYPGRFKQLTEEAKPK